MIDKLSSKIGVYFKKADLLNNEKFSYLSLAQKMDITYSWIWQKQ